MTVVRTTGFRVRPESRSVVEELVARHAAAVREGEPGTRLFLAFRDVAEPSRFTLVSIFEDSEAEAVHDTGQPSRAFLDSLEGNLNGAVSRLAYTEVPGTEVPGTEVPGTEVPGTEVPGTDTPDTEVPEPAAGAPAAAADDTDGAAGSQTEAG